MRITVRFIAFLLLLALAHTVLFSQTSTTGSVTVTVTDPTGGVVPGAALEITDIGTNVTTKATTLENGAYTFPNLPFGEYKLIVTQRGFANQQINNVVVQTGRNTDIRVALKMAGSTETVQVTAETPLIEANSSVLADTIDTKQVLNLPMQSRNV